VADRATILVPLDGSELSAGVLKHVERLLGPDGHDVILLTVVAPAADAPAAPGRDAAVGHLATVRGRLEQLGARVTTEVREGEPAAEILRAVEEHRPALVAMSSHGRSGVLRWIRGSVAERVLRTCRTPLLLVTPPGQASAGAFRRILVPLDGSERSAGILDHVVPLARRHGAEVLVLRVEWEGLNRPTLVRALSPERVAESLKPALARLAAEGVAARAIVAQGDVASELLDAADREDVDLLAMTTHGRTGLERLVDGSVAEKVLRHCKRPLLVVRNAPAT
jgi:nucleotide-binding universal stress UspA family protein